jgi:acyl-coenzyme A thioesterase PaaI-like protein
MKSVSMLSNVSARAGSLHPPAVRKIAAVERHGLLQLPHTAGCLVCGRDNPHGLRLDLHVDPASGVVRVAFTPRPEHIGFEGVVHGGVIATVLDEAMVWCATWAGRRFCVCAELTTRFKREAAVGRALVVETKIESNRPRLITTAGDVRDAETGEPVATGSAKYVPVPHDRNRAFLDTLVADPATEESARALRAGA